MQRLRASVVCVHNQKLLTLRLEDPLTHRIRNFPPGGMIERGETPEQAALRETLEETGYSVCLESGGSLKVLYPFLWGGTLYQCTTHFFRAGLNSERPIPIMETSDHRGVEWIPLKDIATIFSYSEPIARAVLQLAK